MKGIGLIAHNVSLGSSHYGYQSSFFIFSLLLGYSQLMECRIIRLLAMKQSAVSNATTDIDTLCAYVKING